MLINMICGSNYKIMLILLVVVFALETVSAVMNIRKNIISIVLACISGTAGFIYLTIKTLKLTGIGSISYIVGVIEIIALISAIIYEMIKRSFGGIILIITLYSHSIIIGSTFMVFYHYMQNIPLILALTFLGLLITWFIMRPPKKPYDSEDIFGNGYIVTIDFKTYTYTKVGKLYYVDQDSGIVFYRNLFKGLFINSKGEVFRKTCMGMRKI